MFLSIIGAMNLHLEVIDTLVLKEGDLIAIAQVAKKSSIAPNGHIVIVVHKSSDAQDGDFHLHSVPTDVQWHAIDTALSAHFPKPLHDSSAC